MKRLVWIAIIGYFLFEVIPSKAQVVDLEASSLMELSLEDLMNIEVTVASKKAEKLSDAAGVVSVVTMDEIERFGGITLRDILERVPSLIGFKGAFTEGYGLASRGDLAKPTSSHILLLINGRPVREVQEGGVNSDIYAAFPVKIIERIEVIRGPGSVLYGSNAFSAVINLVTKTVEKNSVAVTGLTGGDGAIGADLHATVQADDFSLLIAGRYMDKGGQKVDYTAFDAITQSQVTEEVTFKDISKAAHIEMRYKNLSLVTSHNGYEANFFVRSLAPLATSNRWNKTFNNLGYEVSVNDNWSMDLNATYSCATLVTSDLAGIDRKSNDIVLEWTNHINLSQSSQLIIGGLYNYIKAKEYGQQLGQMISDGVSGNVGFYSQIDWWLRGNVKLIGGFQANKPDRQEFDIVPRVGAIWYPIERLNVKALYSQAYKSPSMSELNLFVPGFIIGNPDLRPEKTRAIDIGMNYQGEHFQLGINYFNNSQKDIITQVFNPEEGGVKYENLGEIDASGIELEGKYFVNKQLFFSGSLMQQSNNDQEGNEDVSVIANMGAKLGVSYRWEGGITLSMFDVYQGNIENVGHDGLNPEAGSYHLLNAYASFDLANLFNMRRKGDLSFFIQADNILNQVIWSRGIGGGIQSTTTIPNRIGASFYTGLNFSIN